MLNRYSQETGNDLTISIVPEKIFRPRILTEEVHNLFTSEDQSKLATIQNLTGTVQGDWVYMGSGGDMRPYIFSPPGTTHHYVDISYSKGQPASQEDSLTHISSGLSGIGLPVENIIPITILGVDGGTTTIHADRELTALELHGNYIEDRFLPHDIGVIVFADLTPVPDPQLLINLPDGGLVLNFFHKNIYRELDLLQSFGLSLEDFGVLTVAEEQINFSKYNEASNRRMGNGPEPTTVQVMEKLRSFTPEEEQLLTILLPLKLLKDNPQDHINYTVFPVHTKEEYYGLVLKTVNSSLDKIGKPNQDIRDRIRNVIELKWDVDKFRIDWTQGKLNGIDRDIFDLYNRILIG